MKRVRILWITDPWDTLDHARDTTLRLAEEAIALRHESYWCDVRSIRWEEDRARFDVFRLESHGGPLERRPKSAMGSMTADDFQNIHYRVDPPVDLAYLEPLQLLTLDGAKTRRKIVNNPEVLFSFNEKTIAAELRSLMPEMLVSSEWDRLEVFGGRYAHTVLKTLFEAQSRGVALLDWTSGTGRSRARRLISRATRDFTIPVVLQQYLPAIQTSGEQRLWFLDGKLLAHAGKLPLPGDFRVNIDRGSQLIKTKLTRAEKNAAIAIGKFLRKRSIRLAAVDLIDAKITDFNFTSPGLLRQMEAVTGKNLAAPIIIALARASARTRMRRSPPYLP